MILSNTGLANMYLEKVLIKNRLSKIILANIEKKEEHIKVLLFFYMQISHVLLTGRNTAGS